MIDGFKLLQIQKLALEVAEEALHGGIVIAVAFAAHALSNPILLQYLPILLVLVVPALVGVQDQLVLLRQDFQCLFQHRCHHQQIRTFGQSIGHNVTAAQIHDRGQVQLLTKQPELRHIRCPLLVRLLCLEVPIQQIFSNFAHFTLVRTVFLHPNTANKAQFLHQPLYCLVIDDKILVVKLVRDAPVAIPSLMLMEQFCDLGLDDGILILPNHALCMVVEGCSWKLSDLQQQFQIVFLPQFLDHLGFLLWCRSSSKTKACNFFRYASSARSL